MVFDESCCWLLIQIRPFFSSKQNSKNHSRQPSPLSGGYAHGLSASVFPNPDASGRCGSNINKAARARKLHCFCIVSAPLLHFNPVQFRLAHENSRRHLQFHIPHPRWPVQCLEIQGHGFPHCCAHPNYSMKFSRKSWRQGPEAQNSGNARQRDVIERQRHAPIFIRKDLTGSELHPKPTSPQRCQRNLPPLRAYSHPLRNGKL